MVLETQYIPDIEVTEDTDTEDEFAEYESIYIQSGDQNIEATEETLIHEEEQAVTELPADYNHEASNEHEDFQVVEAVHITGSYLEKLHIIFLFAHWNFRRRHKFGKLISRITFT